jgi:hypothetical protein
LYLQERIFNVQENQNIILTNNQGEYHPIWLKIQGEHRWINIFKVKKANLNAID